MFYFFHAASPDQYQQVHDQTGVDTGTQAGYAVFLSDSVQFSSQFRALSLRIGHFFCGSDYVQLLFHDELQLVESVLGEGIGAQQNDISSARLDYVFSSADQYVRSVASFGLDEVVHALTDLCATAYSTYDVNALLLQQHVSHTAAHSA